MTFLSQKNIGDGSEGGEGASLKAFGGIFADYFIRLFKRDLHRRCSLKCARHSWYRVRSIFRLED